MRALSRFGDEGVFSGEGVGVRPVSVRLAAELADEHGADALARVGRQRIRVIEDHRPLGELVHGGRELPGITGVMQVGAHRVDGDEDDVQILGKGRTR